MTIFGVPWDELSLAHVQSYLIRADDEPLLWEAKGTKLHPNEVRRQVCAFANSHEGGYLILGAEKAAGEGGGRRWVLDGVQFPDEPPTWITNVVGDLERGVRPRPDFDVKSWEAPNGHVAVVRVTPTSTPPCLTNGTVYQRQPGKSETVRDPAILADLFARGDEARRAAQARADRAAQIVLDELEGEAGVIQRWVGPLKSQEDPAATRTRGIVNMFGSRSGWPRQAIRRVRRAACSRTSSWRRSGGSSVNVPLLFRNRSGVSRTPSHRRRMHSRGDTSSSAT